jgi:predicted nucleic acid-binding protein
MKEIVLIVTDASPLITLAVAGELDVLFLPHVRVIVPDMVRFEVARHADKAGAQETMLWIKEHEGKDLVIGKTQEYEEFKILYKHDPKTKTRNRGEQAAAEILAAELKNDLEAAILLFEDSDIKKANFLVRLPDNVLVMSTSTYLDGLQRAKLISSADNILNKAAEIRGREINNRTIQAKTGTEEIVDTWETSFKYRG